MCSWQLLKSMIFWWIWQLITPNVLLLSLLLNAIASFSHTHSVTCGTLFMRFQCVLSSCFSLCIYPSFILIPHWFSRIEAISSALSPALVIVTSVDWIESRDQFVSCHVSVSSMCCHHLACRPLFIKFRMHRLLARSLAKSSSVTSTDNTPSLALHIHQSMPTHSQAYSEDYWKQSY